MHKFAYQMYCSCYTIKSSSYDDEFKWTSIHFFDSVLILDSNQRFTYSGDSDHYNLI